MRAVLFLCTIFALVGFSRGLDLYVSTMPGSNASCTDVDPCLFVEAINRAVAGDSILVNPGTYNFTNNTVSIVGLSDIVIAAAQSANRPIFDGGNSSRILTISNTNLTIRSVVFSRGYSMYGGAIYSNATSAIALEGCEFQNNLAMDGGAIWHSANGMLWLTDCILAGNNATNGGGAIWAENVSGVELLRTSCWANRAAGDHGGCISVVDSRPVSVANCTFDGSWTTEWGGAIYLQRTDAFM